MTAMFPDLGGHWYAVSDADPRVANLYTRHYSYRQYRDNRRKVRPSMGFAGVGEKIVLLKAGKVMPALVEWTQRQVPS